MMTPRVDIFTDGACSGNPGIGGWGAILRYKDVEKELSGGEPDTTNNRMELTAVIEALNALKTACNISLCTDSQYVMKGVTEWLESWKGPSRDEFWDNCSKNMTGDQKWLLWCLENFLNIYD